MYGDCSIRIYQIPCQALAGIMLGAQLPIILKIGKIGGCLLILRKIRRTKHQHESVK